MPYANQLFEKLSADWDKNAFKEIWNKILSELREEGIIFNDWFKLKENVRNWYGRALVSKTILHSLHKGFFIQ